MALVISSIKDKTLDWLVLLKKFHWSNEHFFQNEYLFWALGGHFLQLHSIRQPFSLTLNGKPHKMNTFRRSIEIRSVYFPFCAYGKCSHQ